MNQWQRGRDPAHCHIITRALAAQMLTHAAYSVLDNDTGKQMNNGQLKKHPKFQ